MGMMAVMKNIVLLLLLVSASLLSTSVAGRGRRFLYKQLADADEHDLPSQTNPALEASGCEEAGDDVRLHERFLKDYGNYEPAPALRKPPSMIINN